MYWMWGPNHGVAVPQNNVSFSGLLFPRLELATWQLAVCVWSCVPKAAGQSCGARGREAFPTALLCQGRYLPTLTKELLAWLGRILLEKRSCASTFSIRRRKPRLKIWTVQALVDTRFFSARSQLPSKWRIPQGIWMSHSLVGIA